MWQQCGDKVRVTSIKNCQNKNKKTHVYIIRKPSTKFHTNLTKDAGGVAGDKILYGLKDERTEEELQGTRFWMD